MILHYLSVLLLLVYGGINDYRTRQIPDLVPVGLIIVAILDLINSAGGTLLSQGVAFGLVLLLIARIEWAAYHGKGSGLPGGDLKLFLSLAFAEGIMGFGMTIIFTGLVWRIVWLNPAKKTKSLPLCTYVAAGYSVWLILLVVLNLLH